MNEKYSRRPRDALDRRIDLEERPALRRTGVGRERADAEADDGDFAAVAARGSACQAWPNGPVWWK